MSVNIPNPSYKLSEREDYSLIVESGGVTCDCEIKSASWRFDKGSINNIFNVFPTKTGSITTDYDFYEGQELSFYYQGYDHSGFIGRFTVISVGETGTDSKTYQLENKDNANMNENAPAYTDYWLERYFSSRGLRYKDMSASSTAVMSAFGICLPEEIDADFKVLYTSDYNKFSDYTLKDLMMLRNATLVDIDMFYHFNESDGDITIDNIRQSSESSTGFVRTGLDYVGITFTYIKQTKKINEGGNKSFEFENLMVTTYETETVTEYFYYSDTEGFTHSQTKPNGNGIIYEYPFVVGEKNGENHYNNFINFVYGSFMQDFLTRIESTDLTPRSITIPFHPDYFDTGSYVRSYTIYDTDVYDLYGDENEELELTNEQYSAYVNSRKYKMPVFITTLNYNGAFSLELSTGEQFEGSNQNSTQSNSTINITTSTSQNVNIDSLMANISNLQKSISDLTTNFVNKVEFADTVAELMEASKIDGSALKDIHADTITSGTMSADRIDSDAIATKVLESETLTTDIAKIADARIKVATIEDAQISSINGNKITEGSILAAALSSSAISTLSGTTVFYQAETPTAKSVGDVWYHTVVKTEDASRWTDNVSVWDGTSWVTTPMDAKMLVAGSVTAREIQVDSLSAISANLGNITAGSISVSKNDKDDAIVYVSTKDGDYTYNSKITSYSVESVFLNDNGSYDKTIIGGDGGILLSRKVVDADGYRTGNKQIQALLDGNGIFYLKGSGGDIAVKSDIPSLSGYATQTWVNNKGYTTNTGTVTSVAVKMNGATKGTVTSSGTIDLGTVNTCINDCCVAYRNASTSTTSTSNWTKVPVNTFSVRSNTSLYTISNDGVKISTAGYYLIYVQAYWTGGVTAGDGCAVGLFVNDTAKSYGRENTYGVTGMSTMIPLSLSANDVVNMRIINYSRTGSSVNANQTYISIVRLK